MKILLSAGHGGFDSGSIGADRGKEKDRTIELTNMVASKLRTLGHNVTVKQEKNWAGKWSMNNRSGYDYALSIHFNAFNGQATGTECFYKGTVKKATAISSSVSKVLGLTNRGAKNTSKLYMINIGFDNLVEICFHDNQNDLNKYNNNKIAVADAIVESVNGSLVPSPKPTPEENITGDIVYQSYDNVKRQWLPEVINDSDYAGNFGNALGGLRAKPQYGIIYIQAHELGKNKWLETVNSNNYKKDAKGLFDSNTYAGNFGKKIDGIKVWSTQGYVSYRVHIKGGKWLDWVHKADNTDNGYAGIYGREIDAIQMK